MSISKKAFLVAIGVILFDQLVKIWIKTHMMIGEEYNVIGDWFRIHFTENNGMAFGMELGGFYGKLFLTLFRLVAVIGIIYYMKKLIREKAPNGLIICFALILAGAFGNIIDSVFYGMIFNDSYHNIAQFLPEGGGYSSFLHGRVVDMLYFPIIDTHYPSWIPKYGGQRLLFFRPVFNIADSAITTGVISIFLFQRKYFRESSKK